MTNKKNQYGIVSAICMVVGSVIGSGIFFKAEQIDHALGGNSVLGAISWGIGGIVMLVCLSVFACFFRDFSEKSTLIGCMVKTVGLSYAYYVGVFMATVYYPSMCSVLSYLCSRYTLIFLGAYDSANIKCMFVSILFLFISFVISCSPASVSGKIQVTTTFIKLIPLFIIIFFGIFYGGESVLSVKENIDAVPLKTSLYGAVAASAFAYDGWISVVSIGEKIKNRRKNLPLALILGGVIVVTVYILYHVGLSSTLKGLPASSNSKESVRLAFDKVIKGGGGILTGFVAISCFGALNALMLGCTSAMNSLAQSGRCPFKPLFLKTNKKQTIPIFSYITGLLLGILWLIIYFSTQLTDRAFFSLLAFDSSELPVVTAYVTYIPIFFMYMKECRKKNLYAKCLLSAAGLCACMFMAYSAIIAHRGEIFSYACFLSSLMLFFSLCEKEK